jgi:hypothetical protein
VTGETILSRSNDQVPVETRLQIVLAVMSGEITIAAAVLDARRVPVTVPFRTQHPLGAVVNRPSVWSDR